MKFLKLPVDTLLLRYYLMMVVVIVAGFTHTWLLVLLALPIFLSCLLGVRIAWREMKSPVRAIPRVMHPRHEEESKPAA